TAGGAQAIARARDPGDETSLENLTVLAGPRAELRSAPFVDALLRADRPRVVDPGHAARAPRIADAERVHAVVELVVPALPGIVDGHRGVVAATLQVERREGEDQAALAARDACVVEPRVDAADAVVAEDRDPDLQALQLGRCPVADHELKPLPRLGLPDLPAFRVLEPDRGDRELAA